ncbi:hypothetical protein [Paenibacillus ihuae]|uniref:hypothetical protein n=1 Tax=Paenibacillus ihuae TaxID=1232431 RepID=UPI0006D535FE|nr:hypothetical protein [Paenibacillus ihuae]
MTKLDGNERWKSKMLLTEHVEQYEEKHRDKGIRNNILTSEELSMVRDLILLPHIDTMLSRSMKEIENSGNILTKLYLLAGRFIQNKIMQDTYKLQKELRHLNVRFIADEQDEFISYYKIFYRGYQERFGITRDVMRSEISLRLTRYTADLGDVLKSHL